MKRLATVMIFAFCLSASVPMTPQSEAQMGMFAYSELITLKSQVIELSRRVDALEKVAKSK